MSVSLLVVLFPVFVLANDDSLDRIINKKVIQMSLEEKVGQLFIIGFPFTSLTPELDTFLKKYKPGSFLLFKRNIKSLSQLKALNSELYRASYKHTKLPPFIAIDQEGGAVSRLPIYPAQPNALAIGSTSSPIIANELGDSTGLFLREVGINMNLAPVLDLAETTKSSFIGVRSFGSDADLVAQMGLEYSKGLIARNVVPTAKHFPGTGNEFQDPHKVIVKNMTSKEDLLKKDILPFTAFAKLGSQSAIMMSHLVYPALDSKLEPATFSKKIITELLRNELNYKGIVMTDDLQMSGSRLVLSPEEGALRALQAGADIVMLTWSFKDQSKSFEYILKAARANKLSIQEIDDKVKRILKGKAFANSYKKDISLPSLTSGELLTSNEYSELDEKIINLNLSKTPALVTNARAPAMSSKNYCLISSSEDFISSFTTQSTAQVFRLNRQSTTLDIQNWLNKHKCPNTLAAIHNKAAVAKLVRLHQQIRSEVLLINLGAPSLTRNSEKKFKQVINLYFNHSKAGKKIFEFLKQAEPVSAENYVLQ